MVQALAKEIHLSINFLGNENVETIYFGGGTPSLLTIDEIHLLINEINKHYSVSKNAEITLEANPENLNPGILADYNSLGINRLSIGIQSFNEKYLKYLNRSHTSEQAKMAIRDVNNSNISNYSLDLIFGIQSDDLDIWREDLNEVIGINPTHLSIYNLTIESNTVFGNWLKKGKIEEVGDDDSAKAFVLAHQLLSESGYDHYEISNYCRDGYYSRHNSSYWQQKKYLGIGPGAHSFNKTIRRFNVKNNHTYLRSLKTGTIPFEQEELEVFDQVNEMILTGLRTKWGLNIASLLEEHSFDIKEEKRSAIAKFEKADLLVMKGDFILLTLKGQLLADSICEELMLIPSDDMT